MSEPGNHPLRDELADKKIIDFTDEELIEAGFKGDDVPESVTTTISQIKARPSLLGFVTGLMVYCQKQDALNKISAAPSPGPVSPTTSESSGPFAEVTVPSDSALTPVGGDLVSPFEQYNYYIGICEDDNDVPVLYYRTSLKKAPFPMPKPGDRVFKVAKKTVHGPFDKVLTRNLWNNTVGPKIIDHVLDAGGIKYASLQAVRFSACDEEGKENLGPIVVWLGTHPGTTTAERARDVSPDILKILSDHGVSGAEVEWYEARAERLGSSSAKAA
ncbi:hypothetical protein CC2G_012470 [Coprinopsis cinerea AmutBmut pab1-1]|nr:hypothetical protein CC2G_012470 [Coprinopsis cinerea AmutBmut pab1-1]